MNKVILVILLFLSFAAFGQYAPFKKYNFNQGGYTIIGLQSESDYNALAAKLGEFYTDDINTLNQIKATWFFLKKSPQYSCGYHYTVLLCKNRKVIESLNINLNCEVVASSKGYYYFDINKLALIKNKFKKPLVKKWTFKTVADARTYLEKSKSDKNLILPPYAQWEKYDGEFSFEFKFKFPAQDSKQSRKKLIKKLRNQILVAYPNEPFTLEDVGGSNKEMYVQMVCKITLKDKFKLYPEYLPWSAYRLDITTYSFQSIAKVVAKRN